MGFNVTRFRKMGLDWSRGDPPPRGSIEYVGVGDMFMEEPAMRPQITKDPTITFSDLDAADRWVTRLWENIKYARKVHGDRILSKSDVDEWEAFVRRWNPFRDSFDKHAERLWEPANKKILNGLLDESYRLHDRFVFKGMPMVPVPYMGELVMLLRQMPKVMRTSDMRSKLEASIKCGNRLLDQDTAWWQWRKRSDSQGLSSAIEDARSASRLFARSKNAETYEPGSPVYDEFLRRLTKIYLEAAGLYGIVETKKTAAAEAMDKAVDGGKRESSHLLWLLVSAGVGYLGLRWISRPKPAQITVRVPDAHPSTPHGRMT